MRLRFDKPAPAAKSRTSFVVRPLDSLNMSQDVERLGLNSGQWCFALVHDHTSGDIVVAEVHYDGMWCVARDDIINKEAFQALKKEEGHKHTFKAYQKACLAEAVLYSIVKAGK